MLGVIHQSLCTHTHALGCACDLCVHRATNFQHTPSTTLSTGPTADARPPFLPCASLMCCVITQEHDMNTFTRTALCVQRTVLYSPHAPLWPRPVSVHVQHKHRRFAAPVRNHSSDVRVKWCQCYVCQQLNSPKNVLELITITSLVKTSSTVSKTKLVSTRPPLYAFIFFKLRTVVLMYVDPI